MKAPLLALVLVLGALALPPGASAAGEPLLTDAEGDAEYRFDAAGTQLPALPGGPGEPTKGSDILSLALVETEENLVLTLAFASFAGDPAGVQSHTHLVWGDRTYRVAAGTFISDAFGADFAYAELHVREGTDWDQAARLARPEVDRQGATITVTLPKVYLMDSHHRTPGRGDAVEIPVVTTETFFMGLGLANARMHDSMPDEGASGTGAAYTLTMGDYSEGDLVLSARDRVRVSNGGATTFVFQIHVQNLGDAADEYALAATDLPDGWDARLQSPVRVDAKSEKTVSLLVSVPFAHDHGGFSGLNVTAQSTRDAASQGRMRLGVLHTPIPQPAGHHSELYLHARDPRTGNPIGEAFAAAFPFSFGWMNTEKDDAQNHPTLLPFEDDGTLVWWIPLSPSLLVGLDFDLQRDGTLEATIEGHRDGEAEIVTELYYFRDSGTSGERILLAEAQPVSVTLSQQEGTPFSATLVPTPESDYIAYEPGSGMALIVTMTGADARDWINTPLRAQMVTDSFTLTLPLNEYHDRLTGVAEAAQVVEILAKGLVEKLGRPGSVLTYAFEVRNTGAPGAIVFELAGNDVEHAVLLPRGEHEMDTGETREVTVAVELPVDANPGQEFEVLLFVHARDDPSKMAIARTKTKVAAAGDADVNADESDQLLAAQARERPTPGAGVAIPLAAAAVLALARRRRA